MPCIASSFWSAHKPCGSCNATKSREWLNLIYKIAGGLSCRTDNVCSWHIASFRCYATICRVSGHSGLYQPDRFMGSRPKLEPCRLREQK